MPRTTEVSRCQVFYILTKVMQLVPVLQDNQGYDEVKHVVNDADIIHGIDDELEITDDLAHKLANELWLDVLANNKDDFDSVFTFEEYMKLLAASAPGFVYAIALDAAGTANGVIWMTATMRDNVVRFGSFIPLDTMKRGINKWLWPYMAIVMYNELSMICLACKSMMLAERTQAYAFLCRFILKTRLLAKPKMLCSFLVIDSLTRK